MVDCRKWDKLAAELGEDYEKEDEDDKREWISKSLSLSISELALWGKRAPSCGALGGPWTLRFELTAGLGAGGVAHILRGWTRARCSAICFWTQRTNRLSSSSRL